KLEYYKFRTAINPFGILFHPEAIARFLEYAVTGKQLSEADLEELQGRFVSFDAHSALSASSASETTQLLNEALFESKCQLTQASHIVITLGTAWGYRHVEQDKIVANCHKIPQKAFQKELSSVEEIAETMRRMLSAIAKVNSEAQVIFTVSPVRHTKDGFVENQRSKAHLLAGMHQVLDESQHTVYFPSYELMMDELRDYRFYDRDLIHPNALAVDYIWERFSSVYFSEATQKTMQKVQEIQRGLAHKPFNPDSEAHQRFLRNLEAKKRALQVDFPHIQF
ncbi:MAG: GSCFA domain-containing protein, partial [Bacteroidota bacterium]|nr:GSCFA domain-containing protein [Bacteroidota bacterium]